MARQITRHFKIMRKERRQEEKVLLLASKVMEDIGTEKAVGVRTAYSCLHHISWAGAESTEHGARGDAFCICWCLIGLATLSLISFCQNFEVVCPTKVPTLRTWNLAAASSGLPASQRCAV